MSSGRQPRPLPELDEKVAKRFWAKVARGRANDCWVWEGTVNSGGVGTLGVGRSTFLAPRLAWAITYGKDPYPDRVRRRCGTPRCVNPRHLKTDPT